MTASIGQYKEKRTDPFLDGPNVYLYVHNNPINFIDPLGLSADEDENIANKVVVLDKPDSFIRPGDGGWGDVPAWKQEISPEGVADYSHDKSGTLQTYYDYTLKEKSQILAQGGNLNIVYHEGAAEDLNAKLREQGDITSLSFRMHSQLGQMNSEGGMYDAGDNWGKVPGINGRNIGDILKDVGFSDDSRVSYEGCRTFGDLLPGPWPTSMGSLGVINRVLGPAGELISETLAANTNIRHVRGVSNLGNWGAKQAGELALNRHMFVRQGKLLQVDRDMNIEEVAGGIPSMRGDIGINYPGLK